MKTKFILSISVILLSIFSYGNPYGHSVDKNRQRDTTKLPAVETNKANSDYKPVVKGQTRVAGVKTVTAYKVEKIAEKLGKPWAVVPMPDGRLLITDKSGYMQIHDANGNLCK